MAVSKPSREGTFTSFTVDADVSGVHTMPGVTTLLNRKKLEQSNTYKKPVPPPFQPKPKPPSEQGIQIQLEVVQDTPTAESFNATANGISLQLEGALPQQSDITRGPTALGSESSPEGKTILLSEQSALPPPVVQKTRHTETTLSIKRARTQSSRSEQKKLQRWSDAHLEQSGDPLAKACQAITQSGSNAFLFCAPVTSEDLPTFAATAFYIAPSLPALATKEAQWRGIRIPQEQIGEYWNELQQKGRIDLPPPGTVTRIDSRRNILRAALGALSSEHLTILRCGSNQKMRGILFILSPQAFSISAETSLQLSSERVGSE